MTTTSQLALLKQKLLTTKKALADLNEDQHEKFQLLLQFINQLSLACKGQNIELDNRLAKLRKNLTKFEDIDAVTPELTEIEQILKHQYQHIMLQLEDGRTGLSQIIRQLQRVESLPNKLKKDINYFKKDLTKPFHTFWDYIPRVEQMVEFYNVLLKTQLSSGNQLVILPKHQQLAIELLQMIGEIQFQTNQQKQLTEIKDILANAPNLDTLIDAYQTILSLLLENIAREKSAAQEFLFTLNKTLSSVRDVVSHTYEEQKSNYDKKKKLNRELNNQVDNIDNSIFKIDSIHKLKEQVTEQLSLIRIALGEKEAIEELELEQLKSSIQTMKNELNQLNKESQHYKERLLEQQKLNLLDKLTQLPNRAALEERMEHEYRILKQQDKQLWIAVADIDHFKKINDNFGHTTGDKTLQVLASVLKNSLREGEFVARYGGEEFVFLIPNVNAKALEQLLNRVRRKVRGIPFKFKNQKLTVTISIGAAQVTSNESINDAFERADAALYKAKNERDCTIIDI